MDGKTVTIQVRTTPEIKAKLDAHAQKRGMNRTTRLLWIALANEVGEDDKDLRDEILASM